MSRIPHARRVRPRIGTSAANTISSEVDNNFSSRSISLFNQNQEEQSPVFISPVVQTFIPNYDTHEDDFEDDNVSVMHQRIPRDSETISTQALSSFNGAIYECIQRINHSNNEHNINEGVVETFLVPSLTAKDYRKAKPVSASEILAQRRKGKNYIGEIIELIPDSMIPAPIENADSKQSKDDSNVLSTILEKNEYYDEDHAENNCKGSVVDEEIELEKHKPGNNVTFSTNWIWDVDSLSKEVNEDTTLLCDISQDLFQCVQEHVLDHTLVSYNINLRWFVAGIDPLLYSMSSNVPGPTTRKRKSVSTFDHANLSGNVKLDLQLFSPKPKTDLFFMGYLKQEGIKDVFINKFQVLKTKPDEIDDAEEKEENEESDRNKPWIINVGIFNLIISIIEMELNNENNKQYQLKLNIHPVEEILSLPRETSQICGFSVIEKTIF